MPAIYAELTPPIPQMKAIDVRIGQSPAIMATLHKRSMTRLAQRSMKLLRVEPAKRSTVGITRLMTRKQARFVHALRAGRDGAYERTHAVRDGWKYKVEALAQGGEFVIYNDNEAAGFVEGFEQQPFLKALGWLYAPPLLADISEEAEAITVQNFQTAFDPFAGVPR